MRVLLDECIDRRLAKDIKRHYVRTVPQMKWASLKNGVLLSRAQKKFDIFVTVDRNLSYQQNLSRYDIAVIVLIARSNRLIDLRSLIPQLIKSIPKALKKHKTLIST